MNIAIDIRPLMSPNRTGVGEYTYELINALLKTDSQNQYFLYYNSSQDVAKYIPDWQYDNVHYVHTKWPNKIFSFCQKISRYPKIDKLIEKQINQIITKDKSTNVILNSVQDLSDKMLGSKKDSDLRQNDNNSKKTIALDCFFSPNLNFTSLSKNIKHILTIHDLSFELYPQYYSFKRRLWHKAINARNQCGRANIILTPSKNTKQDLVKYFKINPDKIKTIYPGVSLVSSEYGIENSGENEKNKINIQKKYNLPDNFILYLGTIEPRKNIIGLIEAFEKFQAQQLVDHHYSLPSTHYSLIIAGASGWKNKLIYKKASDSKYKDYIKFIGYLKPEDKPIIYSLAKVFVYPSFYEGFGFPILEAMICNTPVITSNRSSLPEISNQSAYLVNPHKIDEISFAIKNIVEDNELREYHIKKGKECAKKYDWEKTAKEFLETVNS